MVSEGKYGAPFEVQINGDFVYVEDNTYKLNDKPLSGKNFDLFNSYLGQFIPIKKPAWSNAYKNISNVELFYEGQKLLVKNNSLYINDSTQLGPSDFKLLHYLAQNVNAKRVDLVPIGLIGKDYSIWYKGEELVMKKRKLTRKNGKPLSNYELNEARKNQRQCIIIFIPSYLCSFTPHFGRFDIPFTYRNQNF